MEENMKKYVLIGDGDGICGSTLYHEGRIIYLKKQGFDVYYINPSFNENKVVLDGIVQNNNYLRCEGILNEPSTYSFTDVKKILKQILNYIDKNNDDSVFIETTSILYGLWGEMIAKEINAIHFLYIIQSYANHNSASLREFVLFKYKQDLVGGMQTSTVPSIIGNTIRIEHDTGIAASWSDPLFESCKCDIFLDTIKSTINEKTKVIGYFGTLDKAYVNELIQSMIRFSETYQQFNYVFLFVGSSSDGSIEKQLQNINSELNYKFYNIPSMYPVPRNVFRIMDCCIGSFGSAIVPARVGIPTIRLCNDYSLKTNGIIGYTLISPPYSSAEPIDMSLSQTMKTLLIENFYKDEKFTPPPEPEDYFVSQKEEDKKIKPFIERNNCYEYFDTVHISYYIGIKHIMKKILYHFFGIGITNHLLKIYRRF